MNRFNTFEVEFDFSQWREVCMRNGVLRRYAKGEYFAHSGQLLKSVGWVVSGGFKHSLIDDHGCMKSVGFVFGDSILANYMSVMLGRAMPVDVIALDYSEVYEVPASLMRDHFVEDASLNATLLQALFDQAYINALDNYRFTPEMRYKRLLGRCSRIFDLLTVDDIASYLNISRRQLYRFRKSNS